jgi:hypothetical protein
VAYTLSADLGFAAGYANGVVTYTLELGYVDGVGQFVPVRTTGGQVFYQGNMIFGAVSGRAVLTVDTEGPLTGQPLAVRFSFLSTNGSESSLTSDYFGIDNVVLRQALLP